MTLTPMMKVTECLNLHFPLAITYQRPSWASDGRKNHLRTPPKSSAYNETFRLTKKMNWKFTLFDFGFGAKIKLVLCGL